MIFGRKEIVKRILKILKLKSIVFVAERRVGKTVVLKELLEASDDLQTIIYLDVEDVNTPIGFVEKIISAVYNKLTLKRKAKRKIWLENLKTIVPKKIKGVELRGQKGKNWKKLLTLTIEDICQNTEGQFILLLDEIPYMLQKIHKNEKGTTQNSAIEILNTLRALMATCKDLRLVYTGSIGLHHVINDIRNNLSSEPINDMDTVELQPLSDEAAIDLAQYHIQYEEITIEDIDIIKNIIIQCDNVPFYIEKIIKRLSILDKELSKQNIDNEIEVLITDASDELEMSHYITRLEVYYLGSERLGDSQEITHEKIIATLLDNFATTNTRLSIDDCHKQIKSQLPIDDRDLIIKLLDNLAKDYYIKSDTNKHYQFRFSLIKRWWQKYHGLTSE